MQCFIRPQDLSTLHFIYVRQARNQLGTQGAVNSFLRGAQFFLIMSNRAKNFAGGASLP